MFERSSASVDRETGAEAGLRSKRTASAHGLNMSAEGRTGHIHAPATNIEICRIGWCQFQFNFYVYENYKLKSPSCELHNVS